jgi:hypothetical protein
VQVGLLPSHRDLREREMSDYRHCGELGYLREIAFLGGDILSASTRVTCQRDLTAHGAAVSHGTLSFESCGHENPGSWQGRRISVLDPDGRQAASRRESVGINYVQ